MRYLEESSDCVYHSYRELEEHWTEKIKDRFHTSEDCMSNIYKDNMGFTPTKKDLFRLFTGIANFQDGYISALNGAEPTLGLFTIASTGKRTIHVDSHTFTRMILRDCPSLNNPGGRLLKWEIKCSEFEALAMSSKASSLYSVTLAGRQRWR